MSEERWLVTGALGCIGTWCCRQLVREVEFPRGHALNPMTDAEVEKKFRTLAEPYCGKERAARILAACWELETLRDAGELLALLT